MLSTEQTLAPGDVVATGTHSAYLRLTAQRPEKRIQRTDLISASPVRERQSLLHVAQLSDLHVVDVASPGRFEFAERLYDIEEMRQMLPAHRPHEFLSTQALNSLVQAVNEIQASPVTRAPLDAVLITGDLVDNAQNNELQRFGMLINGGRVHPTSNGGYEGVASSSWGDDAYWHPEAGPDEYKTRWGFPEWEGLLEQAASPFEAPGLRHRWLGCHGNHDCLVNGTAVASPAYQSLIQGSKKAATLPDGALNRAFAELFEHFLVSPEHFLAGEARPVSADPGRRVISRQTFRSALTRVGRSLPAEQHLADGAMYYAHDFEHVRLIALDTVNSAGHWDGSLDEEQYSWLHGQLIEAHSVFYDEAGKRWRTGNSDRLVGVVSHHPLNTLTNLRTNGRSEPRLGTQDLLSLLHRFPNVVLMVNGHTHDNRIDHHADPTKQTPGFWEVTTASLVDWPCEGRLLELTANDDGTLSIFTTMISSSAPADPTKASGLDQLASLHRELAANDPHAGMRSAHAGTVLDRTTELRRGMSW